VELLSPLLPFISPGTEEDLHGDAMELIFSLVDADDSDGVVCQILCSDYLTQIILSSECQYHSLEMIFSKGTVSQLTAAFSDLLSTPASRLQAIFPISTILRDVTLTSEVLQAFRNSNLLEVLFEDLIANPQGSDPNQPSLSPVSRAACLDPYLATIIAYCDCFPLSPTLLEPFVASFPSLDQNHKIVLLRCLTKIITAFPGPNLHTMVPSDLAPLLFSQEICVDLVRCAMGLTEKTLSLDDLEYLQHLIDYGLLPFLSSLLHSNLVP
jgi:hypothetical protein